MLLEKWKVPAKQAAAYFKWQTGWGGDDGVVMEGGGNWNGGLKLCILHFKKKKMFVWIDRNSYLWIRDSNI